MTHPRTSPGHSDVPIKIVGRPEALHDIAKAGVAGVIWQRRMPEDFQDWINDLPPQNLPFVRAIARVQDIRKLLLEVCRTANTPESPNRNWLVDDVCLLAETLARLMSAPYLQLRFDVVSDDACRKFHMDMIRVRLICTYRGRGTQYGLVKDANDPEHILNVPTGDPILLRGTLWKDQTDGCVRHRSPPIAGTGETRLVLVLDALQSLDPHQSAEAFEPKRRIAGNRSDAAFKEKGNCA